MMKAFSSTFILFLVATQAIANSLPSQYRDDYDKPKYERIFNEDVIRYNEAKRLLQDISDNLSQAQSDYDQARKEASYAESKLQRSQIEIVRNRRELEENENEINQLRAQRPQVEDRLRQFEANVKRQEMDLAQALRKLEDAKSDLAVLQKQKRQKEIELQAATKDYDQKRAATASLNSSLSSKKAALEAAKKDLEPLKADLNNRLNSRATLSKDTPTLKADYDKKQGLYAAAKQEYDTAEKTANDKLASCRQYGRTAMYQQCYREGQALKLVAAQKKQVADAKFPAANTAKLRLDHHLSNIAQNEARITKLQNELIPNAENAIQAFPGQILDLEAKVRVARKAEFDSNAEKTKVANEVNALNPSVLQSERRVGDFQAGVNVAASDLEKAQGMARMSASRLAQINSSISERERSIQGLRRENMELMRDIANINRELPRLRADVGRAGDRADRLNRTYQDQQLAVEQRAQQARYSESRLAQVQQNYDEASAVVTALAESNASTQGYKEGNERGNREGRSNGESDGQAEGSRSGRAAGIARDEAAGRSAGENDGEINGRADGRTQGLAQAAVDGPRDGRSAGLQAGYDSGYSSGINEGRTAGDLAGKQTGQYDAGYKLGYQTGLSRASQDADRVGGPQGTKRADDEELNSSLSEVTLSQTESRSFASWEDSPYYRPTSPNYPHEDFESLYAQVYRDSFIKTASARYSSVYPGVYQSYHDSSYTRSYNDAINQDYDQQRKQAYDTAYSNAYSSALNSTKASVYKAEYDKLRRTAYESAYPTRIEEGRKAGYAKAFADAKLASERKELERGKSDGNGAGYSENYSSILAAKVKEAYDAQIKHYQTHAVLKVTGMSLVDANEDGVFAPGEAASMTITVKNFGHVSQSMPLSAVWISQSNGVTIPSSKVEVVSIPGKSEAKVTQILPIQINKMTKVGSREQVSAEVSYQSQVLSRNSLNFTVEYPYAVVKAEGPEVVLPDSPTAVEVEFRNVSTKTSNSPVSLVLKSLDGKADVLNDRIEFGRLSAGETKYTQALTFEIEEDAAYSELQFEIQIFEGEWLLGTKAFTLSSSKRWSFNASSKGLVVTPGGQAARMINKFITQTGLLLDVYDEGSEGAVSMKVLENYYGKMLALPTVNGLSTDLVWGLSAYTLKDGVLYAGMTNSDQYSSFGKLFKEQVLDERLEGKYDDISRLLFGDIEVYASNQYKGISYKGVVLKGEPMTASNASQIEEVILAANLMSQPIEAQAKALVSSQNPKEQKAAKTAILYTLMKQFKDDAMSGKDNFSNSNRLEKTNLAALSRYVNTLSGSKKQLILELKNDLQNAIGSGVLAENRSRQKEYSNALRILR